MNAYIRPLTCRLQCLDFGRGPDGPSAPPPDGTFQNTTSCAYACSSTCVWWHALFQRAATSLSERNDSRSTSPHRGYPGMCNRLGALVRSIHLVVYWCRHCRRCSAVKSYAPNSQRHVRVTTAAVSSNVKRAKRIMPPLTENPEGSWVCPEYKGKGVTPEAIEAKTVNRRRQPLKPPKYLQTLQVPW